MCGWLRLETVFASRSKRARTSADATEVLGQHLDRDVAAEAGVAGAVHLAHAAGAERTTDLVGAETGAGGEWHRRNVPTTARPSQ